MILTAQEVGVFDKIQGYARNNRELCGAAVLPKWILEPVVIGTAWVTRKSWWKTPSRKTDPVGIILKRAEARYVTRRVLRKTSEAATAVETSQVIGIPAVFSYWGTQVASAWQRDHEVMETRKWKQWQFVEAAADAVVVDPIDEVAGAVTRSASHRRVRRAVNAQQQQRQDEDQQEGAPTDEATGADGGENEDNNQTGGATDDRGTKERVLWNEDAYRKRVELTPIAPSLEQMMLKNNDYWTEIAADASKEGWAEVLHFVRYRVFSGNVRSEKVKVRIRQKAEKYHIENDRLYVVKLSMPHEDTEPAACIVVPRHEQYAVFALVHECAGHPGVAITKMIMKRYVAFVGMTKKVTKWIGKCTVCGVRKTVGGTRPGMSASTPRVTAIETPLLPNQVVSVDLAGPFRAAKGTGNRYIAVFVDHLTRYVVTYPLLNAGAGESARALRAYCELFSSMRILLSDRGTSFTGQEFQMMCRVFEVKQKHGSALCPASQALAESSVGAIKGILHTIVKSAWSSWDTFLGRATYIHNTRPSTVTNVTPFETLLGYEPRTPLARAVEDPEFVQNFRIPTDDVEYQQILQVRQASINAARSRVREMTMAAQRRRAARVDSTAIRKFEIGDTVYAKVTQRADSRGHGKSKVKYNAAKVIGVGHHGGYTVKFSRDNSVHTRNVAHLKARPTWDTEELDEAEGRNRGNEQGRLFNVDRIVDMEYRKDADNSTVMYMKLTWVGYPLSAATWEREDSIEAGRRALVRDFYKRYPNFVPRYNRMIPAEPPEHA